MTKEQREMQPWQVFHAARRSIGAETVAKIFNRSIRSAHDWAQDPAYTQVRCHSPLECLHTLFSRMADAGRGYVVREAIRYLEGVLDPEVHASQIVEPQDNVSDALLAAYSGVACLQQAIETESDLATVDKIKRAAMDEIERAVARYRKDKP